MKKLIIAIISMVLISIFGCKNKADKEIYFIPYGFTGRIVIFYNQDDGVPVKYDEGFRILEIPESGIFKTQFSPNYGTINNSQENQKFYWKSNDGKGSRLLNRNDELIDSNTIQIFGLTNGNFYPIEETIEMINGKAQKSSKTTELKTSYRTFIVDKYSERSKYDFKTGFDEQKYWQDIRLSAKVKASKPHWSKFP